MKLIVGLGNPGRFYSATRHNIGYLVVKEIAKQNRLNFIRKHRSLIAKGIIKDKEILVCLPLTFMNLSGEAVRLVLNSKNVKLENLLVVCDDLNLNFSQLRLRPKGSAGGHKGLESIIKALGSGDFARLRIGIGRNSQKSDEKFVLSAFNKAESKKLKAIIETAADCCLAWIEEGIFSAMNKFNKYTIKTKNDYSD